MKSSLLHTRPLRLAAAALVAVGLTATACSSSDSAEDSGSGDSTSTGTFPATVETAFGDVTISEQPQRIVALGWGDADTALALGAQPIAASDWTSLGDKGVGSWVADEYEATPELLGTMDLSYEQILALSPDLILDVRGSGDPERHQKLTEITPNVIGIPTGGEQYTTTAQQQTTMIAQALGVPEKGEELLKRLDDGFTQAAESHSNWADKTANVVALTGTEWALYTDGDARTDFFRKLGFTATPAARELAATTENFYVSVSEERLADVDADLLIGFVIQTELDKLTGNQTWQALPAVKDNHALILEGEIEQALSLGTTAAQIFALEQLVPKLEAIYPAA